VAKFGEGVSTGDARTKSKEKGGMIETIMACGRKKIGAKLVRIWGTARVC